MSVLPIYTTLKADAELAAVIDVEKKVFEDIAPHGTNPPYIIWQTISGQALNHLDEPADIDSLQYQLMVYASSTDEAYQLRDLCRQALERQSYILNPSINITDPQTKLFGRGFDANWYHSRF